MAYKILYLVSEDFERCRYLSSQLMLCEFISIKECKT